jgi:hypothetical protein
MKKIGAFIFILATLSACGEFSSQESQLSSQASSLSTSEIKVLGTPSLQSCPVSLFGDLCSSAQPPIVLSSSVMKTNSVYGSDQNEYSAIDDLYIGTGTPYGQMVSRYVGMMQLRVPTTSSYYATVPGAGSAWALRVKTVRGVAAQPGAVGATNSTIGYEMNYQNLDASGTGFQVGAYCSGGDNGYTNMAAFYVDDSSENGVFGWHNGVEIANSTVAQNYSVFDDGVDTNAGVEIQGQHVNGLTTASAQLQGAALNMAQGQKVCLGTTVTNGTLNPDSCLYYAPPSGGVGKVVYQVGGNSIFSVDDNGNAVIKGQVFSGAAP